jgi:hypothetical protein
MVAIIYLADSLGVVPMLVQNDEFMFWRSPLLLRAPVMFSRQHGTKLRLSTSANCFEPPLSMANHSA